MEIKDWLKPQNFKFVIAIIALLMLERSISFLITNTPFMFFDSGQPQPSIAAILGYEIPIATMTILWPVVFATVNLIHNNLRVNAVFFYLVLVIHTTACIIAAFMVFKQPSTSIEITTLVPEFGGADTLIKSNVVIAILGSTLVSVAISIFLFSRNIRFFGNESIGKHNGTKGAAGANLNSQTTFGKNMQNAEAMAYLLVKLHGMLLLFYAIFELTFLPYEIRSFISVEKAEPLYFEAMQDLGFAILRFIMKALLGLLLLLKTKFVIGCLMAFYVIETKQAKGN